jgi:hypothetical protein
VQKKGKGAADAKWDAETRKSLANKKSAAPTLTKQQQGLVQAQREKEAKIRAHVVDLKRRIERGLSLVGSVVDAKTDHLHLYVSAIATLLVRGTLNKAPLLVGSLAFETYLVGVSKP